MIYHRYNPLLCNRATTYPVPCVVLVYAHMTGGSAPETWVHMQLLHHPMGDRGKIKFPDAGVPLPEPKFADEFTALQAHYGTSQPAIQSGKLAQIVILLSDKKLLNKIYANYGHQKAFTGEMR